MAHANVESNGLTQAIRFEKSDAFKATRKSAQARRESRFDLVVLDPPKLARHARGIAEALRGYHSLNRLALEVLGADGILVTCSCTGYVERQMFEDMLADAARSAKRRLQILEVRGAAADHPTSVACKETDYLKCYIGARLLSVGEPANSTRRAGGVSPRIERQLSNYEKLNRALVKSKKKKLLQERADAAHVVRTPVAEQLLIGEIPAFSETQILCTSLGRGQFAQMAASYFSQALVTCHFFDRYLADRSASPTPLRCSGWGT